jgi:hypothetical protein
MIYGVRWVVVCGELRVNEFKEISTTILLAFIIFSIFLQRAHKDSNPLKKLKSASTAKIDIEGIKPYRLKKIAGYKKQLSLAITKYFLLELFSIKKIPYSEWS